MAMLTATIIAIAVFLIYYWTKKRLTYWKDRGVKGPSPIPLVGNIGPLVTNKESLISLTWQIYQQYPGEQAVGIYMGYKPILLIRNPELLKHIFIKDFSTFQDRGMKVIENDKFEDNLFVTEGETWRVLRHKLTPIFTSGKLRTMIPLIEKCIEDYLSYVDKLLDGQKEHEMRSLAAKYTLEVIGTCAFGVDMGTFTEARNIFYETAILIFTPSLFRKILISLNLFIPNLVKNILKKYFNVTTVDPTLKIFFMQLVNEIIQEREGKPKTRNDFMDLMIELKEQGKIMKKDEDKTIELEMDTPLLAAQALVFFAAGFDTSSATMSFMMFELAHHPDIQQRVYDEVIAVTEKHNGKLNYESIKDMAYLEMCFDETLRKYPVIGTLERKCTENYKIPDSPLKIEKNTKVMISVLGFHRDPLYFKDPEVFDPERFSEENKHSIPRFSYLPFGDGPRNCIGKRFAKVQSMLGMASFLRKFKVEKSAKTPETLEFDPRSFTLTSKEGIWLNIIRR